MRNKLTITNRNDDLYCSFVYLRCRMPFLAATIDTTQPLFDLVMTPGSYLHHVEVADQDPTSGSL